MAHVMQLEEYVRRRTHRSTHSTVAANASASLLPCDPLNNVCIDLCGQSAVLVRL